MWFLNGLLLSDHRGSDLFDTQVVTQAKFACDAGRSWTLQVALSQHIIASENLTRGAVRLNLAVCHSDHAIEGVGHETHVVRNRDDADAVLLVKEEVEE